MFSKREEKPTLIIVSGQARVVDLKILNKKTPFRTLSSRSVFSFNREIMRVPTNIPTQTNKWRYNRYQNLIYRSTFS